MTDIIAITTENSVFWIQIKVTPDAYGYGKTV